MNQKYYLKISVLSILFIACFVQVMATRMKGLDYRPTLWYYDLLSFIHNDADDADDDDNTLDFTEVEHIDVRLTLSRTLIAITIYFAFLVISKTFRSLNVVYYIHLPYE